MWFDNSEIVSTGSDSERLLLIKSLQENLFYNYDTMVLLQWIMRLQLPGEQTTTKTAFSSLRNYVHFEQSNTNY